MGTYPQTGKTFGHFWARPWCDANSIENHSLITGRGEVTSLGDNSHFKAPCIYFRARYSVRLRNPGLQPWFIQKTIYKLLISRNDEAAIRKFVNFFLNKSRLKIEPRKDLTSITTLPYLFKLWIIDQERVWHLTHIVLFRCISSILQQFENDFLLNIRVHSS